LGELAVPTMKLSERSVARLIAPTPTKKQVIWWDDELKGFGALLSGATNTKTYVAQRVLPSGLTRRVTIAAVAEVTLKEARDQAAEVLLAMRRDEDPKASRRASATLAKSWPNTWPATSPCASGPALSTLTSSTATWQGGATGRCG
jgi:hypothetical protein